MLVSTSPLDEAGTATTAKICTVKNSISTTIGKITCFCLNYKITASNFQLHFTIIQAILFDYNFNYKEKI